MSAPLAALDDLDDPGSAVFTLTLKGKPTPIIAVRQGERVFGYVNSCPHIGVALDYTPGQVLDMDKRYILCSTHGALFEIESGECLAGPCRGKGLTPVPLVVAEGKIHPAPAICGL